VGLLRDVGSGVLLEEGWAEGWYVVQAVMESLVE
jgi:hypothetical protein